MSKKPAYKKLEQRTIDHDSALERMRGNQRLFNKVLRKFIEIHSEATDDIRKNLETGDFDGARMKSHTIKGEAGYIAAVELQKKGFRSGNRNQASANGRT